MSAAIESLFDSPDRPLEVSVIVPVRDEEDAVSDLAREIALAFEGWRMEILFVDDASQDATADRIGALANELPALGLIRHARNAGQSRAIRTGILAARASIIVTLDGDGQNDPADAPRLVRLLANGDANLALIGGERRVRRDVAAKRWASKIANTLRRGLLNDRTLDTGCGLKVFRRDAFLRLPYFDHMHRYLPALMIREGFSVEFAPVGHRPRIGGRSKYTNLGRLGVALFDLAGVMWLNARARNPGTVSDGRRTPSADGA